ncbi:thioesterase family protein [Gordonia alkanivorans]|uniref:thioesterase family protein n=1 Tax=Gordonia alkanivorans TaxID=84096 RepID=UPI000FDEF3E5|nr:thioesterase family protein [Gordonia alkanivorans]AZZ82220.1 thioesterase family protein [Gordonia alkanivorans]
MESSYYVPVDAPASDGTSPAGDPSARYEYFQPTDATLSVWSPTMQHGGPPSALLMRSLLRCDPDPSQHFTRVTTEILGPIGLGVNRIHARVIRPGRQICLVETELEVQRADGSFRTAAKSVGWRIRGADTSEIANGPAPLTPLPDELPSQIGFPDDSGEAVSWGTLGFIGTVESARTEGRYGETPAVWLRAALPLVEGEKTSDLEAMFIVIDVANGVGTRLRPDRWSWMNTDTTVHLTRVPSGPWVGIDANMVAGPDGFGATLGDLYDTSGYIGRSAQTVLLNAVG